MSEGVHCIGEGVTMFQLLAVKSALKLESIGMKHSRGSVRKAWAPRLGLKPRQPHADFIAAIETKIKECEGRLQPGDITPV